MPRHRTTLHVGRLAGVPIGIQPLWLVVVGLLTYVLGHDYFPSEDHGLSPTAAYGLGLLSALALFAGIVAHELGHAVVARRRGVAVQEIDLWLLGGVSRLEGEPREPGDELRFAAAGPAVSAVILVIVAAVRILAGDGLPDWARAFLDYRRGGGSPRRTPLPRGRRSRDDRQGRSPAVTRRPSADATPVLRLRE